MLIRETKTPLGTFTTFLLYMATASKTMRMGQKMCKLL
jgi:hypothetical protein